MSLMSNRHLVCLCDSFPYDHVPAEYIKFQFQEYLLGYVRPPVADALSQKDGWMFENGTIRFSDECLTTFASRCSTVKETVTDWRRAGTFQVLLEWRDELYDVFAPDGQVLFTIERSASPLFGVATFGVHMTCYMTNPLRIWVPTRAKTKSFGGMCDNSVAGGIAHGVGVLETLIKESKEEASLDSKYVCRNAKAAGLISYHYIRTSQAGGETGLSQPEYEYVFDLLLQDTIIPHVNDSEVEKFDLYSIEQVQQALALGAFKPNSALVLLDFLIRHGIITTENEPHYSEIQRRMHRSMPFPIMK